GPRVAEEISGRAARASREFRRSAQGKKIQQRGGRALWAGGVAAAREKYCARENGARAIGKNGAAASDDRSDGRERADGRRGIPGVGHPVQKRIAAIPEQDAARLRLSASAHQGQPARRRRGVCGKAAGVLSRRGSAEGGRRAGVCGAEHAVEAASAPRRVVRMGGQSAWSDRPARARAQGGRRRFLSNFGGRIAAAEAALRVRL